MRQRFLDDCAASELRPLLEEECRHWADELLWDFSEVAEAVAAGLEQGQVSGRLAQDAWGPVAYCYALEEDGRFSVGSLFATRRYRGQGLEEELLAGVLADAQSRADHRRVECQTLFSTAAGSRLLFERAGFASLRRHYLVCDLAGRPAPRPTPFALRNFRRDDVAPAARLIHETHEGSVDAAVNLTYATVGACRSFVETLVFRAGCGRFEHEASFVAQDAGGEMVGLVLATRLSSTNGHVCQVSVRERCRGRGLGSALVAATQQALARRGMRNASLSVTVENDAACRLYRRLGFRVRKEFGAHAWVRPPERIQLPA